MAPIPRTRPYSGPALFSYGFRPFFLSAGAYAALAIVVWVPLFYGDIALPTAFAPRDWHVHEMLYGYVPAVITGFLLTAIPNWTGRLPLQGMPLVTLFAVWIAGRLAVTISGVIGWAPAAALDVAFLVLLAAAAGREIVAGKNWRNLKVLIPVLVLAVANALFHVEAHTHGTAEVGERVGLAAVLALIMLIGGRIVPSFTRNWLVRENPGRLPASFDRFDAAAMVVSIFALVVWALLPDGRVTATLLALAAILQAVRLARWAGDRTTRDRLVLVLHVAYTFVPVGFALLALAALAIVPQTAGVHAWTTGAIGLMTLAVMTRATLGHTGHALAASPGTQVVYAACLVAALIRIAAALLPEWSHGLMHIAGLAWFAAFGGFVVIYGPMLVRVRRQPARA